MSESCTFCQIIRGKARSTKVYENEKVVAFLSNRPVNTGHTLVVPKQHYENIFDISEEEVAHLYTVVKKIASAVKMAVNAEGVRIIQNNGEAAGQVIFHFHVHVIPFTDKSSQPRHGEPRESSELENDARRIRQFL
jgi:histidine triad (HIT) family protein